MSPDDLLEEHGIYMIVITTSEGNDFWAIVRNALGMGDQEGKEDIGIIQQVWSPFAGWGDPGKSPTCSFLTFDQAVKAYLDFNGKEQT